MDRQAGDDPAEDLPDQAREQSRRRDLTERAADLLQERYDLPADQAHEFLDKKADEDDRGPADVAEEILQDPRLTEQP